MALNWRPPIDAHPASYRAAAMLACRAGVSEPLLCPDAFARVDEIRRHLATSDAWEIGAAYLLECSGYERGQLSFEV